SEFLGEPADPDTEVDTASRQIVEIRDHLRRVDRLPLRYETDTGPESERSRVGSDERQCREGIEHALRITRHATIVRVRILRCVVRKDQHVLGYPHRMEAGGLDEPRRLRDVIGFRQVAERERDANLHGHRLSPRVLRGRKDYRYDPPFTTPRPGCQLPSTTR